jgi:hypothetical protein
MNTPSPGLLRKALKIVDEIEKVDQQIHHLLSHLQVKKGALMKSEAALTPMAEEIPSHLSNTVSEPQQKKEKISQEKIESPAVPQHEQQSLLMEDTGVEQLALVESKPFEMKEESSEQSCCLF